jgi:uncharacterized protein (DUF1800 family)
MQRPVPHSSGILFLAILVILVIPGSVRAAPPAEVAGPDIDQASNLTWSATAGADDYNVYRGLTSWLALGEGAQCHGDEIAGTAFASPAQPPSGQAYFYLVTAESNLDGEGTAGTSSTGTPRVLRGLCDPVMRGHILDRTGYGWDEWSRDRITALGVQGYIDEQLNPATIDESSNTELSSRTALLVPPDTVQELGGLDVVNAVYARRQLEQQATMFWDNHFNTDWRESSGFFGFYAACPDTQNLQATKLHYDLQNELRDLAFNGNFREILEAMALSPAMMIYLNTNTNVKAQPNENFGRELLELHSMSVDGGYTQQDIVELARVFTGWNVCKKTDATAADPLAACLVISAATYCTPSEPAGQWVRNFRTTQHDTGQKVLFLGTPYQVTIPSTAANPANGINDVGLALDAILAHPSTPRYIARKLLQRFVDENPTQAMIDSVVAEWNDAGNPHGKGDLREVLRAVLAQARLRDPGAVGNKIKTPFEHVVSALRAVRGRTDGPTVFRGYLQRMQEQFHLNSIPTGYSELGNDWIDTNNLLDRQNFGYDMAIRTGAAFGADVIGLLNANGVSTAAVPNNAAAIVDFYNGVLFGGALTTAERQAAINYLNTDDNGVTTNYTDARIRETVGFLLGYAQFLEQ